MNYWTARSRRRRAQDLCADCPEPAESGRSRCAYHRLMHKLNARGSYMAKVQTRRSLSVSGATYARLAEYAKANGRSVSQVVEGLVAAAVGATANLTATPPRQIPTKPSKRRPLMDIAATEKPKGSRVVREDKRTRPAPRVVEIPARESGTVMW